MKKLMFALGLAVVAAGAQAAAVNWKIDGNADGWGKYYTSVYVGEKSTFENILNAEGMTAAKVADALKGYTDNYASTLTRGRKDGSLAGMSAGDVLTFIVYDAATTADASNYYISQQTVTADMLYEGTAAPASKIDLTAASFSAATPFGSSGEAIPEPTSAMLLLVGAAGLALRRRR